MGHGPGKIKEEGLVGSPGLKCMLISPPFLSKLLMVFWVYTYFGKNILKISKILVHIRLTCTILIQNNSFKKGNASDVVFLILKNDSSSLIHETFIIFFECPGGLRSVGPSQSELTRRREDLKNHQFWGTFPTYKSSRYVSITFFE